MEIEKDIDGKQEQIQVIKKDQPDQFDEELDQGKRAIDQVNHQDQELFFNQDANSDRDQKKSPDDKSQNIFQTFEKKKLDQLGEMEPEKDQSIEASRTMNKKTSKIYQGCNCQKSKCSKNYCECFTQGRKCNELCKCMGCQNHSENQKRLRVNDGQVGERACFCKKSNCLKKYCECYNNNIKCSSNCKCQQCKNTEDGMDNNERGSSIKPPEAEEAKGQSRKDRSEQEIEEINSKIDEITRITPPQYQQLMFSFLEYWLA